MKLSSIFTFVTAVLMIVCFFVPWWSTWDEPYEGWMSGWHRATKQPGDMYLRFDAYGRVGDVSRAPAPILYFYLSLSVSCLIISAYVDWRQAHPQTSGILLALFSTGNLAILAIVIYTDHLPRLINSYFPFFWRAMYGLYASIFLNVCMLNLAIIGIKSLKPKTDEQQIDTETEPI